MSEKACPKCDGVMRICDEGHAPMWFCYGCGHEAEASASAEKVKPKQCPSCDLAELVSGIDTSHEPADLVVYCPICDYREADE